MENRPQFYSLDFTLVHNYFIMEYGPAPYNFDTRVHILCSNLVSVFEEKKVKCETMLKCLRVVVSCIT